MDGEQMDILEDTLIRGTKALAGWASLSFRWKCQLNECHVSDYRPTASSSTLPLRRHESPKAFL